MTSPSQHPYRKGAKKISLLMCDLKQKELTLII
uniref:Uncharacterized protein n=1 Tax=Rhizophora mucronata TaxID=61149 RepID=A0A2P2QXI9_RHIMU